MRMRSRKKKEQLNSQSNTSPQLQPCPFEERTSAGKEPPGSDNEAKLQRSPLNFADIAVFASNRPSAPIIQPKLTIGQPNDAGNKKPTL